ncbi:EamA family transporter [Roseospira marina]|uniref:EamA family transporter n=1 Tax=Roseospira marina TaxID=140057 RepID=A0A5M6ID73_9PROT|nr:EamA family transporter [Roseospira marina]KAA5605568.1 EamA family transporter [Roseospira marina]MBB4313369.1 drug/metabolite transporter (DMT)-like permease [Roseospira marina]MBB5085890.1 drug/metabolite transporter (DMT)-like permease [Roseospira marina]
MNRAGAGIGIALAFVCLFILGVMPVIVDSRPTGVDALSFALFLSLWQLLAACPFPMAERLGGRPGLFGPTVPRAVRRRTLAILLLTGGIFGISTYLYVLAVETAGPVGTAIAIQAYPLFAIVWESVALKRRKTGLELLFTALLLAALYVLVTDGTGRIGGLSPWFLVALSVPFLWSIAHVILREVMTRTPITPAQVTLARVLVSVVVLGVVALVGVGPATLAAGLARPDVQAVAALMGAVYYLELIVWFHAVRIIDVSLASSIAVPWPAVTMALTVVVLGEPVAPYQIAILGVVVLSLYGLLYAGARARRAPVGAG